MTAGVTEEVDAALALASAGDNSERQCDVLEHWCAIHDEVGDVTGQGWALLARRATELGRWPQVVLAGRTRATIEARRDPRSALAALKQIAQVAAAHGLVEQGGWVHHSRCETLWVLGDWDAAIEAGQRALDLAEQYAYQRLAFRTFTVLLHIGAERRDVALAERWDRWWATASATLPAQPSRYARVLMAAVRILLDRTRGQPVTAPPASLLEAFVPVDNPHFLAAVETITRAWLDAGRADLAGEALARVQHSHEDPEGSALSRASAALLKAWLSGSAGDADRARALATEAQAPWWAQRASPA